MSDAFSMFGEEDEPDLTYGVNTWQFDTVTRVTSPGGAWDTLEEAKQAAHDWTGVDPADFVDAPHNRDKHASRAYKEKLDIVVIHRDDQVVSSAPLTPHWKPTT